MSAPTRPFVGVREVKRTRRRQTRIQRGPCDRPPVTATGLRTMYLRAEYHQWERFDFLVAWDAVTLDTDGFAADVQHYIVEFRATNAAGTEQKFYNDPTDSSVQPARWRQVVKALETTDTDERLHAILKHIQRPNTWRYQGRVRAVDSKGRSGPWTAWTPASPTLATRDAAALPPAPTATSQTIELYEYHKHPRFRSTVVFTGVPNNWTLPDGDTEDDVASYDVDWKIWIPDASAGLGKLNAGIASGATSIVLTAGTGASFGAAPMVVMIQSATPSTDGPIKREIVRVTARTTDTLTTVASPDGRNYWGSGAKAFNAGDIVTRMKQDTIHRAVVHDRDDAGNPAHSVAWHNIPHAKAAWVAYRLRSRDRYSRLSTWAPDTGLTNKISASLGADDGFSVPVLMYSEAAPTPPAPTFPATAISYHQVKRGRNNQRWTAKLRWNEVRDWIWHVNKQVLEVDVAHYVVQLRKSTSGGADAWGGEVVQFTWSADHDDDTGNVVEAPAHSAIYYKHWYQFRVRAVARGNHHGPWSSWCTPVQAGSGGGVTPPNPSSVATETMPRRVGLQWAAPADADNAAIMDKDIAAFHVQFADDSAFSVNLQDYPHVLTRSKSVPCAQGTAKWMRVRAVSHDGDPSAWVYHDGTTTLPGSGIKPSKVLSTSAGSWQVTIDDDGDLFKYAGPGIAGYDTPARTQSPAPASGHSTAPAKAWTSTTTAGACLFAWIVLDETEGAATVSATPAGWVAVGDAEVAAKLRLYLYKIENAAARSGTETFTLSAARTWSMGMTELSGIETVGTAQDKFASSTQASTTAPDSGTTATTALANEAWLAFLGALGTSAQSSPTNGFTQVNLGSRSDLLTISRIGSATQVQVNGTALTSGALPAFNNNDFAVLQIVWASTYGTLTPPAGWTFIREDASATEVSRLYYRPLQTGDTTWNWSWTTSRNTKISIEVYRNVDLTTPMDVTAVGGTGATSATITLPAITTVTDGAWILDIMGWASTPALSVAPGDSAIQRQQTNATAPGMYLGDLVKTPAGTQASTTATIASAQNTSGQRIALRPATASVEVGFYMKNVTATGAANTSATISPTQPAVGLVVTLKARATAGADVVKLLLDNTGGALFRTVRIAPENAMAKPLVIQGGDAIMGLTSAALTEWQDETAAVRTRIGRLGDLETVRTLGVFSAIGDAQPVYGITGLGGLVGGAGGASAPDIRIRRTAAGQVTIDGGIGASADLVLVGGGFIGGNKVTFGDAAGANQDTRIRRTGTKEMTLDDAAGGAADFIMSGFLRLAANGFLEIAAAGSAPAAPAAGRLRIYVTNDASSHPQLRVKNSAGTVKNATQTDFTDGA